jgi:hypothetical protein
MAGGVFVVAQRRQEGGAERVLDTSPAGRSGDVAVV